MRVVWLFASVVLTCAVFAQTSGTSDHLQTQTKLAQQMDEFVRARDFSGVVLVARNGQVLFQKAYGSANREHGVANKLDTKFRLGSVTKQFTAMAIMILTERGKLSVTDPICKYIENCPTAWSAITIHHLLTHTSGIPDFTDFPDKDLRAPANDAVGNDGAVSGQTSGVCAG